MNPTVRACYDKVHPLFWPWLWWNLIQAVLWHLRTGRDAIMEADYFGNIRFRYVSDLPKPDDLYSYEAPEQMPWERLVLGTRPFCTCDSPAKSRLVRHDPPKSGMIMDDHAMVRFRTLQSVRGPPWAPDKLILRLRSG